MNLLAAIMWNADPDLFTIGAFSVFGFQIGPISVRWYGLLFALGFFVGQFIIARTFKLEGKPEADLEVLMFYMIISTVLGARLGHCLFYQPEIYLANPIEILKIWEGGLASHGAGVGIFTGLWLYSRSRPEQSFMWLVDRMAIVVALGGGFIRIGNLTNSEIVGKPTTVAWGFVFQRLGESFARHPAQLYEAISCFILFFILYRNYEKYRAALPAGRNFGMFITVLFTLRFLYEFLKENQVGFEDTLFLNMGQILSIPLIIIGAYVWMRSYKNGEIVKV